MGKKGKRDKKAKAKVADNSHVGQPKCLKQILWERGWITKENENMSNVEALDMLMIMSDGPHILAHLAALVPEDFGGVTEDELSSRWSEVSRRIMHKGMLGKLTNEERINIAVQVRQERELLLSVAKNGGLDDSTDVEKMPSLQSKQQESVNYQKSTLVAEDEGEVAVSETKTTKKKKKKKMKKKKKKKKKEEVDSEKDFEDFCNEQEESLPPPQRSPQHPPQQKRYNSFSACLNAPESGADGMTNRERMRAMIESRGHIMM